jgi:OmpA-OmpF porin, OOP family
MGEIRAFFVALAALAAALWSVAALAQLKAENFYVGLSYGQARDKDACADLSGCSDRPDALRGFAGYHFHPRFAVEAGYANLGNVRATGGTFVRSHAWDAVLVASWPVLSRLDIFGKLGAARTDQTGGGLLAAPKETKSNVTYGVGVQFNATQNLGLRVEWQDYPRAGGGPVLPRGDIWLSTIGILWRFK